jgi:hypothetical protein
MRTFFSPPTWTHPTATPFQPGNGKNESPYYVPYSSPSPAPSPTLKPSIITPGTPLVEINLLPTPFPSGFEGIPIFVLSTNTNPLTGLTAADPPLLERRPIAVKITQFPRLVRPQSGLTLADVVYEYYIEDNVLPALSLFFMGMTPRWPGRCAQGVFSMSISPACTRLSLYLNMQTRACMTITKIVTERIIW